MLYVLLAERFCSQLIFINLKHTSFDCNGVALLKAPFQEDEGGGKNN